MFDEDLSESASLNGATSVVRLVQYGYSRFAPHTLSHESSVFEQDVVYIYPCRDYSTLYMYLPNRELFVVYDYLGLASHMRNQRLYCLVSLKQLVADAALYD